MFIIYPSWTLPIPVTGRGVLYFGLIAYFVFLAYIVNRWVKALSVNAPPIVCSTDFLKHVKDNSGLLIICLIAVLLHIVPISSPIYLVGDEALFLLNGLWIYDYFGAFWHEAAKYAFWVIILLTLVKAKIKSTGNSDKSLSHHETKRSVNYLFIFCGSCFLVIYFILIYDLPFQGRMIRYPPLQNFLYLLSNFIFGINYIGARLWQLIFYILSAVYLYRTINLFSEKETALLGTSIYLFSPIIFAYAHFAELASGLIFFIIIISYYFLRFLIYQDNRGLLLSSFFIGTGFLYKRDIFLMFFICTAYLVFHKIRNREFPMMGPLKVLSLSLFPIIPWLIIGKFFTWRNAWISLSQFTSFNKVTAYLLSIPAQLSWVIFFLFVLSFFYVFLAKRSHLSFYWLWLFIAFYCFYTSQHIPIDAVHRFSMAFYPTIAVFISLFLSGIVHKIRWKHTYKMIFTVLTIYLIFLSSVPSFSEQLISYRNVKEQYFPNKQAMQWIRDNVKDGEKILSIRFKPDLYYSDKYGIDKSMIHSFWYNLGEHSTPEKIVLYCRVNKISYIIFPYGPKFGANPINEAIRNYLKENQYIETAKFNLGENYIYILKLKGIS
jgi:hypothetical protein